MFDRYILLFLRTVSFDLIQCVQADPSSFEVLWIGCYVSVNGFEYIVGCCKIFSMLKREIIIG